MDFWEAPMIDPTVCPGPLPWSNAICILATLAFFAYIVRGILRR